MNSEAFAGSTTLLVAIGISAFDLLNQISAAVADQGMEIVFLESRVVRDPERNVLIADRILNNSTSTLLKGLNLVILPSSNC